MKTINIKYPLEDDKYRNYAFKMNDITKDALVSNLILLLSTEKGERYYYPTFGINLKRFLFEQFDGITISDVQEDIRNSVSEFIPQLKIVNVSIDDENSSENKLVLLVDFSFNDDVFSEINRIQLTI